MTARPSERDPASASPKPEDKPLLGATVLLVEDNMLIALEAEDMLRELGAAHVAVASTLREAERLIVEQSFRFAMLDISVGRGTSFDVARTLKSAGTPFIFASGYGEEFALKQRDGDAVVIRKPYQREDLARAVSRVLQAASD